MKTRWRKSFPRSGEPKNCIPTGRQLHPDWPTSPIHQAAIVTEEAGELLQASLNHNEHKGSKKAMITEAIHTAATVIRFLKNIEESND